MSKDTRIISKKFTNNELKKLLEDTFVPDFRISNIIGFDYQVDSDEDVYIEIAVEGTNVITN